MKPVLQTILPSLLGAAGALAATMFPAYYHAVCGGGLAGVVNLPLGG